MLLTIIEFKYNSFKFHTDKSKRNIHPFFFENMLGRFNLCKTPITMITALRIPEMLKCMVFRLVLDYSAPT